MDKSSHSAFLLTIGTLGMTALASCSDPTKLDTTPHPPALEAPSEIEDCPSSDEWLPTTPDLAVSPGLFRPAAHPETECPFYRGWHTFLMAMQPDTRPEFLGEPAIKSYPTIDDVFQKYVPLASGALPPPGTPRGSSKRAWLGDIKQAGGRQILIDQSGHTLYYGIHVNQAFADFIHQNQLDTAKAIQKANPNLFFTAGIFEFKSAWQEVDPIPPATEVDPSDPRLVDFIHTKAWVAHLRQETDQFGNKTMVEDKDHPRLIMVRLLAIHTVFTLPGHPEFIWASMEHSNANLALGQTDRKAADGHRDVAPVVAADPMTGELVNPTHDDPDNTHNTTVIDATSDFLLYKKGTPAKLGNIPSDEAKLEFDEATQTFTNPAQRPSIYRMFPASKSNETEPDGAISSLNHNVEQLFIRNAKRLDPADKRGHYRLVGAQWMDKPSFFDVDRSIQNDETSPLIQRPADFPDLNQEDERQAALSAGGDPRKLALADIAANGGDSSFSLLAGEDRMSSTAMKSFTQRPDSFFNCFSCHNTRAITAKGVPLIGDEAGVQLLGPKRLNVSHVLSEVVLEECMAPENIKNNPDSTNGGKMAVCP